MEKLYVSANTRPGADCGSDHELLITKFRLKLKKVGKTTRLFSYESESENDVAQSCLTLCNAMDCSLPGSSVHGIFQASVLEWGAIAFSCYKNTKRRNLIEIGKWEDFLQAVPLKPTLGR